MSEPHEPQERPDNSAQMTEVSAVSGDFFQGDVGKGLEKMRLRLLDLTARNRLLNFRHTKRSSLRVVDELPDQLIGHLLDGKSLKFRPVPRPRGMVHPEAEELALDDGAGSAAPPSARFPSAREHAERTGIRTDFELPKPEGQAATDGRHTDREIQTLHYPDELEAILRSVSSAARLAIEETGTNMLYLVVGFLEWYESAASNQPRLAPLLLLPVILNRESPEEATRTYRYSIQHSGEELLTNISLQERLRTDFNLELPVVEDAELPEHYFARLRPLLAHDDRWRLRRFATLTLLSFGKLLMYRDLDPETWPRDASIADHPRIKEFFDGIQREEIGFAPEYSLDAPEMAGRVPLLVDDADSSQHSALVDALDGKNLVIEGPPGTGKSQTITNLIAAALVHGKRVLFVSEKLAALEVVRHRLDKVGLGAFCLELHSHKTQKRALLDDLDDRIKVRGTLRAPALLDEKLATVEADRRHLTEYVQLINRPFGRGAQTLHDVIWSAKRRRKALGFDPQLADRIRLTSAKDLDARVLADYRQAVGQFARHLSRVLGGRRKVDEHPWFGVTNSTLTFLDAETVLGELNSLLGAVGKLQEIEGRLDALLDRPWVPTSVEELRALKAATDRLPAEAGNIVPSLLLRLKDPRWRRRLYEFIELVRRHQQIREEIQRLVGVVPVILEADIAQALSFLDRGVREVPGVPTVDGYAAAAQAAAAAVAALSEGRKVLGDLGEAIGCPLPDTMDGLGVGDALIDAAGACPLNDLRFRGDSLLVEGAHDVVRRALADAEAIRRERKRRSEKFDLGLVPGISELRGHVTVAASVGWWGFLAPSYRHARRCYLAAAKVQAKPKQRDIVQGFRELIALAERVQRFDRNPEYKRFEQCGVSGVDGAWDSLDRLLDWRESFIDELSAFGQPGRDATAALWNTEGARIRGVRAEASGTGVGKVAANAATKTQAAAPYFGRPQGFPPPEALDSCLSVLSIGHEEASAVSDGLLRLGIPGSLRIEDARRFLSLLLELSAIEARIRGEIEIAEALKEAFAGAQTNVTRVMRTVEFFDAVIASGVPTALKDWLLHEEAPRRLERLHHERGGLAPGCDAIVQAWQSFHEHSKVRAELWLGTESGIERTPLGSVQARASRAIGSVDLLPEWLDYLRASETLRSAGLSTLCQAGDDGVVEPEGLVPAFDYVAANSLVHEAFQENPKLARFSGLTHEQIRRRFAKFDKDCLDLNRQRSAALIDQRAVPMGNGVGPVATHTEFHLLEREIQKQRRHIPVRQLVIRAGRALQALKPCFMMGPMSVAQYLAPGTMGFDLVIMDEASQLRPEDALGAIARAGQVVIVGDQMQLPPTSFFDRIGEEADEDDMEEGAQAALGLMQSESILDVAASVYRPARMLKWHYRSRHGTLIAYSNEEFYKRQLIVYPSPVAKSPTLGVKFIHVQDGVYEARRNLIEARRVVATALKHMEQRPDESLGLVSLNATQRELIENEFEQQLKYHPVAQAYVAKYAAGLEPFFIKNLENVQGDERDVIYISVTFGPNPNGHVFQRFGPINGPTGHRRLNVLFTRARRRVVVFSSMLPEQVLAGPQTSWGARALKGYLQYAKTGILEQAKFSGREPDSDFEVDVAEALRERGLDTVAQVGVAGYFIDLAVKHPTRPDTFVLGLECDGWSYHSGVTARDRDRLRQSILEDLGWNIHRIWSTDWFKAAALEVDRVVSRVNAILEEEQAVARLGSAEVDLEYGLDDPQEDGPVAADVGEDWMGEAAIQPLSLSEVREQLVELREEMRRDCPAEAPGAELLRDEMVESLLRSRPQSREDWLRKIPLDLRLETDGNQQQQYLGRVIEVIDRLL